MEESMENVDSSSINPNTCIIAIFANFKTWGKNAIKCGKPPKCVKVELRD
jgi:hypothetical protein